MPLILNHGIFPTFSYNVSELMKCPACKTNLTETNSYQYDSRYLLRDLHCKNNKCLLLPYFTTHMSVLDDRVFQWKCFEYHLPVYDHKNDEWVYLIGKRFEKSGVCGTFVTKPNMSRPIFSVPFIFLPTGHDMDTEASNVLTRLQKAQVLR